MASRLADTDNRLLRAWRRGELDETAAQAFEERLFFEPELVEAANADLALEPGLRDARREGGRRRLPQTRRVIELLAAAGLGAAAVLPLALTPPPATVGTNVEWISVSPRRDLQSEPLLVAPRADADLITLEVAVAATEGSLVSLRIASPDGRPALDADGLRVRDGAVTLAFARDALPAGVHSIEVADAQGSQARQGLLIRYQPR